MNCYHQKCFFAQNAPQAVCWPGSTQTYQRSIQLPPDLIARLRVLAPKKGEEREGVGGGDGKAR